VYSRRAERIIGELDTSFDISYGKDGKKVWEKVGWKSQGYTVKLAKTVRDERIRSIQHRDELPKDKKKAPYLKEAWKSYFTWAVSLSPLSRQKYGLYKVHHQAACFVCCSKGFVKYIS
jgi:hypothetical protein